MALTHRTTPPATGTPHRPHRGRLSAIAVAAAGAAVVVSSGAPASASTSSGSATGLDPTFPSGHFRVSSRSFVEDPVAHTVHLPLHRATSGGSAVSYVVLDASTREAARALGVNFAPRLANARGTAAVQQVTVEDGQVSTIPATVDFTPARVVVPGPHGFPPATAVPGAVGRPGYSPLIQLPDGTVLNAPQVANGTGHADKLVSSDHGTAVYRETNGFYDHHAVHYASFEASIPLTAALEDATPAPALDAAPPDDPRDPGEVSPPPAREEIGIVTNGQLGRTNPQRQGLSSALLDGLDPLNILGEVPENSPRSHYSPLWDANLATWTPAAVAAGQNRRVASFDDLLHLADQGLVTAPDGGPFRRSNFVINCPVISIAR